MSAEDSNRWWSQIIDWMYRQRISTGGIQATEHDKEVQVRRIMGVLDTDDRSAVLETLEYMTDVGLLTRIEFQFQSGGVGRVYGLDERGFEVAHQRQVRRDRIEEGRRKDKRQYEVNRGVAFLTLGLVFIGAIQSLATATNTVERIRLSGKWFSSVTGPEIAFFASLIGLFGVLVMGYFLWRAGLLSSWESQT